MHSDMIQTLSKKYADILQVTIPYASDIERMGGESMPLGAYVNNGYSLNAYQALWQERLTLIEYKHQTRLIRAC
jgi:hypothetical protein